MTEQQNDDSGAPQDQPQGQPEPQEPAASAEAVVGAQPEPAPVEQDKDARTMGMLAHLLAIFIGFLGPLIIWLIKKESSEFVDDQGKEALNFQITVILAMIVAFLTTFICIGVVLVPAVAIANLIFCIMGTLKANQGVRYRYPVNIRFIK